MVNYEVNYFDIRESDGTTDISQLYVPALKENVPWGIHSTYIYKETTLAPQFNSGVNKHLVIENKTLTGNIILKTHTSGRTIIQDKLDVKELRFNNVLTNIATTDFSPFMYNIGSTIYINGGLTVSGGNFNLFKGVAGETSELNEPRINNPTINYGLFISGEIIGAQIRNSTISGDSIINNSITTSKILDFNITESKLATNSVSTIKIADNAITNIKIANNIIGNTKYGPKSITYDKIADGTISNANYGLASITYDKIANATIRGENIALATISGENIALASITGANIDIATISITGTNIVNNSINSEHIIDGSILGTDICNLTITESKLAPNSVSSVKIVDNAITNAKIQDNTIFGSKITDNTINNSKIQDNTITNAKIFPATITGSSIAINSINSGHIIDGSILGTDICNLTITENKLASNSVSSVKIVDNAITNAKIVDNNISGSKIVDNTINNSKMQDNTINNSKIQDNTINNSKLQDNTINNSKIQDNTINNSKLLDNTITNTKIQDNTITTNKIADANVTYAKLNSNITTVIDAKAPIANPTFTGNVTANNIKINGQNNSLELGAGVGNKSNQAGHIGYGITANGSLDIHGASIFSDGNKLVRIWNTLYIDNTNPTLGWGGFNSVGSGLVVCSTQGTNGEYVTNMKPLGNTYIEMARYVFDYNTNIIYNRGAIGFNYFNSDIRQKTNIAEPLINNACEYIKKIEFKSFNWKENVDTNKTKCELGVIAQQLESVYPKFININYDEQEPKDETKHKSINTNVFSTFMMKGIQELILENIELKKENELMKKDIELIKQHLGL